MKKPDQTGNRKISRSRGKEAGGLFPVRGTDMEATAAPAPDLDLDVEEHEATQPEHRKAMSPGVLHKLNLPPEVTIEEAGEILGCDRKTVRKLIDGGLLKVRELMPISTRRTYRILLESVLELRSTYRSHNSLSIDRPQRRTTQTPVGGVRRLRHIELD